MTRTSSRTIAMLLAAPLTIAAAGPQVADYERALRIDKDYAKLVDVPDTPEWQEGGHRLLYRTTEDGVPRFMLVDADAGTQRPLFDTARLIAALNAASHETYKVDTLPFGKVELVGGGTAVSFQIGNTRWTCDVSSYACRSDVLHRGDEGYSGELSYDDTPKAENSDDDVRCSPDGKSCAFIRNFNLFVRAKDGKDATQLSWDGSEADYYSVRTLSWSPDSQHLAAYRIRPGYQRAVQFVDSSPGDQLQPKYSTLIYPKAGDVLPLQQPVLFDVAGKREHLIPGALFPNPYGLGDIQWWKDGRGFTFAYNQRGHQLYRVIEVNAATAVPRTLIEESSRTFINYEPLVPHQQDTGKVYRFDVDDGREIVWASERDGHEHLYLLDGRTGSVRRQITKGDWVVRAVDRVDPVKRQIWFEASGMNPGEDPYFVHAYRIDFDGTHLTPLTPEPANHHLEYSEDGQFYADLSSRVDQGPALTLHRTSDNARLMTLAQTDLTKLKAAGWQAPEPFVAKGRDGKTDIWGVIHKPAHFDPAGHYPVIEDIYAGPQGSFVPKNFSTRVEPLTQLGFVVVQIDGMGTNNRSRAFHDVAWQNLADAGFPDRIRWHQAAAAKFPWYDISDVGIFGTSAGGQNTMAALEFHPDFYKAGVANSGSYDNRMDKIWWNEQWMGWPVGPQYSASSTIDNAYRVQGRLMVVVGEMDHNVDPSSAFQLMDRLIKAHKLFDTLYVPGADHGTPGPYARLKLMDFFVRNIMQAATPDWNNVNVTMPATPPLAR
jgi:dipeptidyl aminopeptidase/acylaminoacyl peptidase